MHGESDSTGSTETGGTRGHADALHALSGTPTVRELGGDLPCVVCGYNLRGLSIRGVCPECGTLVRATILAVVDPHAAELQPISRPWLVAAGLLAWIGGALAAALLCWTPHLAGVLIAAGIPVPTPRLDAAAVAAVLVSGMGAALIVRPHARVPAWMTGLGMLGVALYAPLAWAMWAFWGVSAEAIARRAGTYLTGWRPGDAERVRILMAALLIAIIACLRPVARILVARSLVLRTGRVDRQTLLGIGAAAAVGAAGDGLGLLSSGAGDGLRIVGLVLVAIGALLLTMGLLGSLLDGIRIAASIVRPGPSLTQVLHGHARRGEEA